MSQIKEKFWLVNKNPNFDVSLSKDSVIFNRFSKDGSDVLCMCFVTFGEYDF